MLDWVASHQFLLCGIIMMSVIGPAIGNYACSVVYRLPRGLTPFERHPFCGSCNAALQPIDLFPILSWLMTRGKCRYCASPIPGIYTVIELVCGAVFIAYFIHFGISELFILYSFYAVMVVILAAIHFQQGWISSSIYTYALVCVALARALQEHSIYPMLQSGFVMFTLMLVMLRVAGNKTPPTEKPWVWWFTLLGALTQFAAWKLILPIYATKLLVPKPARVIVYAAGALVLPLVLA